MVEPEEEADEVVEPEPEPESVPVPVRKLQTARKHTGPVRRPVKPPVPAPSAPVRRPVKTEPASGPSPGPPLEPNVVIVAESSGMYVYISTYQP